MGSGVISKEQGVQVPYEACQPWSPTPGRKAPLAGLKTEWGFPQGCKNLRCALE